MKRNLDLLGGLHNSQRVLLALTQAGHEPRGRLCGGAAQRHGRSGRCTATAPGSSPSCSRPTPSSPRKLNAVPTSTRMFDDFYHLKHVDALFERVFGPEP